MGASSLTSTLATAAGRRRRGRRGRKGRGSMVLWAASGELGPVFRLCGRRKPRRGRVCRLCHGLT